MNKLQHITTQFNNRLATLHEDKAKQLEKFKVAYTGSLEGLKHNQELQHDAIQNMLINHGDYSVKLQKKIDWLDEWLCKLNTWDLPEWADGIINSMASESDANLRRFKASVMKSIFTLAY